MTFAWPLVLWLLLIPAGFLVWELTHRRRTANITRPKILRAEAGSHSVTLSSQSGATSGPESRIRYWLFAGLCLAIFALARPQYGKLEEPVFDQSREILLAIDLSRSMLAPDVKPSRLDRSKLLIQSLLEKLQGERVGLAVFAGTSFLQSPLSADYEILREFLPALSPDFLPEGGSNYGSLLDTSIQAFGNSNAADRFLVILSDGEATDTDWKSRIDKLKEKNIRVLGLGVGTAGGAMIPDNNGGFIKDDRGAVVLSKLESATLQELSTATGGVYRDASGWIDLAGLVKETVDAGQKGNFLEKNTVRLADRFQWPLALGLWCLLVSFYLEFPVRPRPREIKLTAHKTPTPVPSTAAEKVAASLVLFALLALGARHPVHAAVAGAPKAPPKIAESDPTPAATPPPAPSAALSQIVGRLATSSNQTARDWAELGRETVTWGGKLQSEKSPIPEGPVRDALAGLELGAKLDPKTADWAKLRGELEELLKKSEEQKQEQENQDQKDKQDQQKQDKNNQDKEQKNQDQKSDSKDKQDSKDQKDQQKNDKKDQQDQQPSDDQQKQGESAFGDMKNKDKDQQPPEPAPEPETQKVGGTPEKKEDQPPVDAAMMPVFQKLEQLRNQDSPAKLFQLMEGERKNAPAQKGKDW